MKMTNRHNPKESGGTIIVVLSVVTVILVLLGSAVAYTQHVSRVADRSRKAAQALEVGDGHLEYLFTHWRNISRAPGFRRVIKQPPTNFFYTTEYNPSVKAGLAPAPTPWATNPSPNPWPGAPPLIPKPDPAFFPNVPGYSITQYRIQAVSPMIELDANENSLLPNGNPMPTDAFPTAGDGPNTWQYSIYYLAAADVTVPAMTGNVTAKVRRVFEKKYDNPWTNAMFFHDDLELHPSDPLVIDGPVQTNSNLYIGTSNFTANNRVAYGGEYVNGWSPNDTSTRTGGVSAPNFVSNLPPSQESPYLPFGWNLKLDNAAGNNESYHELIERPVTTESDTLAEYRFYNQASYRVLIDQNNNVSITKNDGTVIASTGATKNTYDAIRDSITTNIAMYDVRQSLTDGVRVANVDVAKINTAIANGNMPGFNGVLYVADTTTHGTSVGAPLAGSGSNIPTTMRGIRLVNASTLPSTGLTFVSDNPVYVKGNFNTGGTSTSNPPSNSGTFTSPTVSGYTRKNSAIIGDAITVLSNNWNDATSSGSNANTRPAVSTTINAALVGGIVKSSTGDYSGGGENFVRLLEDWKDSYFTYYGSMVQLYESKQANKPWKGSGTIFKSPRSTRYFWDRNFGIGAPPGQLQFVAYLQQQRWYQVY